MKMRPSISYAALGLATMLCWAPAFAQSTSSPDRADHGHSPDTTPAQRSSESSGREQQHQHVTSGGDETRPSFIRPLTDEDRRAAFPEVGGHPVHDPIRYLVKFDQLEWQKGDDGDHVNMNGKAWIGRARDRVWLRTQGQSDEGQVEEAEAHVLFGRQFARWWDLVGGIRQDFRPGEAQTWAAFGVQGLAPYWFEIEATGYLGASGRTQARLDVEYDLLLTNRLVLQPRVELDLSGKSDPERGIGAGVNTTDVGFRLRYELRRELAPYVGVTWHHKWLETADLAEAAGDATSGARLVVGLRFWL